MFTANIFEMPPIRNMRFSFHCQEKISDVDSLDHGKTCQRTIIDFRNKTREELDLPKESHESICDTPSEKRVAKGYESYFQLAAATILFIGLSSSVQLHAQEETDPFTFPAATKDTLAQQHAVAGVIIDDVPTPEYPGGLKALRAFFNENLVYPADSVEGKVYVSATVDTSGRVSNVRIKKSVSPLADAEVIRVVKLLIFKPPLINGKPVNSRISLPCSFRLGKKEE